MLKESKNKRIESELNKHRVYIPGNDLPSHKNSEVALRSFFTNDLIKVTLQPYHSLSMSMY